MSPGSASPRSCSRPQPASGRPVLYATGEESAAQVRLRAGRLGLLGVPAGAAIEVLAEHDIGQIVEIGRRGGPALVIVDSIQTATVDELDGAAGSVGQVREATLRLMEFAKGEGIAVVLVGHVTKDGSIAGPKTMEHLVDAVVSLEGERYAALRLVRASKNRFGSTDEVGVFEMAGGGSARGLRPGPCVPRRSRRGRRRAASSPRPWRAAGRCSSRSRRSWRRRATGRRPARAAASTRTGWACSSPCSARRAGIALGSHDVYANLAGGLRVGEPALDLPLALALASSLRDRPLPAKSVAIGEVGLLGELRAVAGLERRLREAARLGFETRDRAAPGSGCRPASRRRGLRIVEVATLRDAVAAALAGEAGRHGDAVPALLG